MARFIGRTLQLLGIAAFALLAMLATAAGALWWWSGTDGSLAWALQQVSRWEPLHVQGVHGALRTAGQVDLLVWDQGGLKIEAHDVRVNWEPLQLLTRAVQIDSVQAADVRVEDHRPPQPKGPPGSLAMSWRPAVDSFRVGRLDWITASNTVTATDLAGHYSFNGVNHELQLDSARWGTGTYRGRARIGAASPLRVNAVVEGRFQAAVPGNTTVLPLDFSLTLLGPVADLQARGRVQVGTGTAAAGSRANASARITPWGPQPVPQARAEFRQLDVGAFWPQAPHTSLGGEVHVEPAGTATWALSADLVNEQPGPWDQHRLPVGQLKGVGEWRVGGAALVRSLQARIGAGLVEAHGQWRGTGGWDVEGTLTGVDPAVVYSAMAAVPVSGRAAVHGDGPAISFDADLKAQGPEPRRQARSELAANLQALELRSASAQGRWDAGLLSLKAFDVRTADARLHGEIDVRPAAWSGSGRADLQAPGLQARADGAIAERSGKGTLQVHAADFGPALRWLRTLPGAAKLGAPTQASGRGDVRLAWQGGWRDPAVQGRLDLPNLQVGDGAASGSTWAVRETVVNVDGRLSAARVQARGHVDWGERRIALELAANGGRHGRSPGVWQADIGSLHLAAADPALGAGTWSLTLQRAFDVRWSNGQFDAGAGQALLAPPAASGQTSAGAPAVLSWDPVRWHSGQLRTAGRITGLPMAWIGLVGGPQLAGSLVAGNMVFDAQWDADLGPTPHVQASLVRTRGDVTLLAETAEGTSARVPAGVRDARVTLRTDADALTLALHWDSERGGTAQGQMATRLARGGAAGWYWPEDAPLSGNLRAQLPRIGVWSLLAPPGWRLRGSLNADIAIAGTHADPQLSGTLAADDLALRSVVDGIELQGGRLRARLAGRSLLIDEFMLQGAQGPGGGGTLVAKGEGSWTPTGPQAALTAHLDRLRASIRSDRQLTVSGDLAAHADAKASEVTGRLTVDHALIVLPSQPTPQLGDDVVVRGAATRPTRTQAHAAEDQRPGQRRLRVAVDIDLGNDFRVRGRGIDTRLQGTLAVSGESVTAPRITGIIHTAGGEYEAYGQRLNIEHGILRFTGPVDNPSLDILAIRPNITQRVGVQVTGSVLTPFVRLYSEPQLADAETLSWLVVGHASAAGGAEAALVQQAALALLAGNSGTGKRGIAASLGLDELSFSHAGPAGPALTLGKRLGRNFYASYESSLSGALGTLNVFYELSRRVTIRAQAGNRAAIDLIFTFTSD